ncbi:NAD(P)H:quinone oxidoreductase [Micromonospora gifhornensis]|uniref:NAD(P)H:quinone oxidoreductase type IV n=1 Tax=Micromonospora gifhornensis TaxID=84594 RepID=A0ABQ4IIP0_9ACTN|nr:MULTISPECIES: NAD(P)H:quinone oxidoreductase [Micromonospora]PMR59308.1 NAD(P)H dehydrogenase [Verrucosispora sp. ts21]GIJ17775.1 NAD(P)H:quinone oxidoreductase type IV [Micromonospora gifhornensis]
MSHVVNLALIYYSSTGTGTNIANTMAAAAEAAGAQVRVRKVAELAPQAAIESNPIWAAHHAATADIPAPSSDDLTWADAIILGSPTRFGNIAAQMKQFFDTLSPLWLAGVLSDKVYSGFTSTSTRHGGHESTLLAMYNTIHHFGGIIVPPGYTDPIKFVDGNPYGTSHHAVFGPDLGTIDDDTRNSARHQAERVVRIARALKSGSAA